MTPRGTYTGALLCPPGSQCAMDRPDPANEAVRAAMSSGTYPFDDGSEPSGGPSRLSYTVTQDPSSKTVGVCCSVEGGGALSLVLTDSAGVVYRSVTASLSPGESYNGSLSYGGLPRGQVILYLSAGSELRTEKFTNR